MTKYKVHLTNLYDCDPDLLNQFKEANYGSGGGMWETMHCQKFSGANARKLKAFYICNDDGKVLSWALYFKHPAKLNSKSRIRCTHIYTLNAFRSEGLGKALIQEIVAYSKKAKLRINVYPGNSSYPNFFKSLINQKILNKKMIGFWIQLV